MLNGLLTTVCRWLYRRKLRVLMVLLLCIFAGCDGAHAAIPRMPLDKLTTLAVFRANQKSPPLSPTLWAELVQAIHEELASGDPELRAVADSAESLMIVREEQINPGVETDTMVTVYLHGDCSTVPAVRVGFSSGQGSASFKDALGWVLSRDRVIEPFIQVNCDRIAQLLHPAALGRAPDAQVRMMATAIARVVLHEWIHVAAQNPHHARQGIARPEFGVADLLAEPSTLAAVSKEREREARRGDHGGTGATEPVVIRPVPIWAGK